MQIHRDISKERYLKQCFNSKPSIEKLSRITAWSATISTRRVFFVHPGSLNPKEKGYT